MKSFMTAENCDRASNCAFLRQRWVLCGGTHGGCLAIQQIMPSRGACGLAHFLPTSAFALLTRTDFCNLDSASHFNEQGKDNISGMMLAREEEWMRPSQPTPQRAVESQLSSLGLLDEEHMAIFRNALGNLLLTEASESTYAEILDGLPTLDSWYEFNSWAPRMGNPIVELEHEELCAGSREKAQKLRSEFDVYTLLFPFQLLRDFQDARPGTKAYTLSLIEILARSCHRIAAFIFQLDDGVHKHALYEAWRDDPHVDPLGHGSEKPPCAFSNAAYHFHELYPNGIADVVGYWAESKIFGGVVVFDRGPSGTERRGMYLHGCSRESPFTLFPPTGAQFESLVRFLLCPLQDGPTAGETPNSSSVPLPIRATALNGWRYHPDDAMSRFHIFRDRYERIEPPTKRWSNYILSANNWPETGYEMRLMWLDIDRRDGKPVDEAVVAECEAGIKRITPSSPIWPGGRST